MQDERTGQVLGGWRIGTCLGTGGMASVYAAEGAHGRRVALKILHARHARDVDCRLRFVREAETLHALEHAGAVRCYGIQLEATEPYMILERIDGTSLEDELYMRGAPLDAAFAARVGIALLDVLEYAHARGVIHRDLKPANVFLTRSGGVKLLDFGLARVADAGDYDLTRQRWIGTPAFMSPEQVRGQTIDARTDVWGTGATLFNLVTGRAPYWAPGLRQTLQAILAGPPPGVAVLQPRVPGAIAQVVDRALARKPEARWQSARAMRAALVRALPRTWRAWPCAV